MKKNRRGKTDILGQRFFLAISESHHHTLLIICLKQNNVVCVSGFVVFLTIILTYILFSASLEG